ncbi:hypothetical protein Tsubulata_037811 [Turnera subulata]|uniref:F-box domain-containing protein n=1 Tax=Turnera subulata TaxID=218843 RepID=A0A9Q0GIR2_9ROSI|nr:hypothetical protein Tsubulata_037811 [Turnera subulata]
MAQADELEDQSSGQNAVVLGDEEGKRRKRRKRGGGGVQQPMARDPLEVLGRDIMLKIMSKLDARSVALSLVASRGWHAVASSDHLWAPKCEELWHGKAHIPRVSQARGLSRLAAYSLSVLDGKRCRIMKDDLCDHAWEFHFGKGAPEYWRNLDPHWGGNGLPMRRYFHPDGSQTADPGDKVWGGHESCYCIVTGIVLGEGKIREHYVRINRWLPLYVYRKQDWSWEMSNSLYCYNSVPDAYKEGGTGPLFLVM